jgi:ATP-dependent DNA helicase RecG
MPDLDSEAIDFRAASESFAAIRPLSRRDLATLRLVTKHQGRRVPTVGGVLLFGIERLRHEHLRRGAAIGTLRRRDRWDLPAIAIREAVVNAVVHADYSQRSRSDPTPSDRYFLHHAGS